MELRGHTIAGLLLAGGDGRRIGGGKAARMLAGRPLLDHVRAFAEPRCDMLFLSVRDEVSDTGLPLVRDAPGLAGPMAGIIAGLDAAAKAGASLVLTLPCDTPFLPADLIERLWAALAENAGAGLAAASSGARLHPAVALIRVDHRAEAERVAAAKQLRLIALFEAMAGIRVEWPIAATPHGHLDPFFNINSVDDLAHAAALYPAYAARQKSIT